MSTRGKAKSSIAPIREIVKSLQLAPNEQIKLPFLTRKFLTDTKSLTSEAIKRLSGQTLTEHAEEFLRSEPAIGKGPIGLEFWPTDNLEKELTYSNHVDRKKIVRLVKYIMLNQRNNLKKNSRSRKKSELRQRLASDESFRPDGDIGTRETGHGTQEETGASARAGSPELFEPPDEDDDLPEVLEIIKSTRAAQSLAGHSKIRDTSNAFATPPATPANTVNTMCGRSDRADRPHPSVELDARTETSLPTLDTTAGIYATTAHGEPRTPVSRRRRERSPTALPVYNPPLPRHSDGRPDRRRLTDRKQGIQDAYFVLLKSGKNMRDAARVAKSAGDMPKAEGYWNMADGVDDALAKLDEWMEQQQERLSKETSDFADFGSSFAMRDHSTTLSPGPR